MTRSIHSKLSLSSNRKSPIKLPVDFCCFTRVQCQGLGTNVMGLPVAPPNEGMGTPINGVGTSDPTRLLLTTQDTCGGPRTPAAYVGNLQRDRGTYRGHRTPAEGTGNTSSGPGAPAEVMRTPTLPDNLLSATWMCTCGHSGRSSLRTCVYIPAYTPVHTPACTCAYTSACVVYGCRSGMLWIVSIYWWSYKLF